MLVFVNGLHNPDVHNWHLEEPLSPYMIGPDAEGHSEDLHYKFIHDYRTGSVAPSNHVDYIAQVTPPIENQKEVNRILDIERSSIQLEMLIYLKIWESDAFIKRFYQLARLINGEEYDWHFKISESNRDNNVTGTRQLIIRTLIRDRFQTLLPSLYNTLQNAYRTQLRNSIAHSKYSFLGRNIHPNNYIPEDPASTLQNVPFDDWIDIFHDTNILSLSNLSSISRIKL